MRKEDLEYKRIEVDEKSIQAEWLWDSYLSTLTEERRREIFEDKDKFKEELAKFWKEYRRR